MKRNLAAFACGVVFSLGLGVSGMTNPRKVIGFLDFFGRWDPSLLFVMASAVAVAAIGFRLAARARKPLLADRFHVVATRRVEARLIVGGLVFGVGWGLSGYCPGPAVVTLATGTVPSMVFVGAMLLGMAAYAAVVEVAGRRNVSPLARPVNAAGRKLQRDPAVLELDGSHGSRRR